MSVVWMGAIASLAHFWAAWWWYRNGWQPFRAFGAIVLGGTGVLAAYIAIRLAVEA